MENDLINKILKENPQTRRIFQGCFPSDCLPLPSSLKYPAALVANLDPSFLDGTHWIAIFAPGIRREIYYFDSFCFPLSPIIEAMFLCKFLKIVKNTKPFQTAKYKTCPHHCISFIYHLSLGYTFDQYLYKLSKNNDPDLFVKNFCNQLLNNF